MKVFTTKECVTIISSPGAFKTSVVNISNMELYGQDFWYVNRILVEEAERGKGLGSKMLQLAIEEIKKLGGKKLLVEPGGYGAPIKRQRNFYRRNGFANGSGKEKSAMILNLNGKSNE